MINEQVQQTTRIENAPCQSACHPPLLSAAPTHRFNKSWRSGCTWIDERTGYLSPISHTCAEAAAACHRTLPAVGEAQKIPVWSQPTRISTRRSRCGVSTAYAHMCSGRHRDLCQRCRRIVSKDDRERARLSFRRSEV